MQGAPYRQRHVRRTQKLTSRSRIHLDTAQASLDIIEPATELPEMLPEMLPACPIRPIRCDLETAQANYIARCQATVLGFGLAHTHTPG